MSAQQGFSTENENATYDDEEYFVILDLYV